MGKYAYFKDEKVILSNPNFFFLSLWFWVPILGRISPVYFPLSSVSLKWQGMVHPTHKSLIAPPVHHDWKDTMLEVDTPAVLGLAEKADLK